ncbi:hypothetical protein AB0O01_07870 [Streptomyces sp. NPDC093252]|uniref:hypothetical protein n=1 Tax=Streptomyces sp. NPDC093252 TaxID=3154980 RepID=UPI00342FBB12
MMFGFGDDWTVLFLVPLLLWIPFGPFLMAATGVWCARRPGRAPRLWSVLPPLLPVTVGLVIIALPRADGPGTNWDDITGFVTVYIGGITVLPWLLGYGITRAVRARRKKT